MSSPIITFRLSTNQIARGLALIRSVEPTYKLINLNQFVKSIYINYLEINQPILIAPAILKEVELFVNSPNKKALNLIDLVDQEQTNNIR